MRILVAHNFYQLPGGEDTGFRSEVALLRQYGNTVMEYTDTNQRLNSMHTWDAARQMIWSYSSQLRLRALILNFRPNIVHFHNTFMMISPAAYYVCQSLGIPSIQTIRNY